MPLETGYLAMPYNTTAHDSLSYTTYDPPIRGRRRKVDECCVPGGWVESACHCNRVRVPNPNPQGHKNCGPEGGGSEVHAKGSVAIQLSWAKLGNSAATSDHTCGRNPGSVIEHGRVESPVPSSRDTQGQSMVSESDEPGKGS